MSSAGALVETSVTPRTPTPTATMVQAIAPSPISLIKFMRFMLH